VTKAVYRARRCESERLSDFCSHASIAKRIMRQGAVLLAVGILAGCQTSRQRIVDHEDDLAAAGFLVRPADTAERRALLTRLPKHKFVQRVKDDKDTLRLCGFTGKHGGRGIIED